MFEKKFILFRAWLFTKEGMRLNRESQDGINKLDITEIAYNHSSYHDYAIDYNAIVAIKTSVEYVDHVEVCDVSDNVFFVKGSVSEVLADIQKQFYAKTQLREN